MLIAATTPTVPPANSFKPTVRNETCDTCGESVRANHVAFKNDFALFFCTHHALAKRDKLIAQGFEINPPAINY